MLKAAMDMWEMKMHLGKTEVMVVSRVEERCSVTIDGEKIEEVQSLSTLGQVSVLMGRVRRILNNE